MADWGIFWVRALSAEKLEIWNLGWKLWKKQMMETFVGEKIQGIQQALRKKKRRQGRKVLIFEFLKLACQ